MIDPYGYGYLSQYSNAVTPPLLNLIEQNETGHLSQADRWDPIKSRSSKDAYGGMQLRKKHLHNLGYKLPPYTVKDALDPNKSRDIAGKFIKGYSDHYGFNNVADTLIGYNMGAKATSDWIKKGRKLEDLSDETKAYLKRAMSYIKNNPDQYSLEKINQEIAEVSNDNQEGTKDMNMYRPDYLKQHHAEQFITGRPYANQGSFFGRLGMNTNEIAPDPYSEGRFLDEYKSQTGILGSEYGNGGDGGLFVDQQVPPALVDGGEGTYGGTYPTNNNTSNGIISSANASTLYPDGYSNANGNEDGIGRGVNQPVLSSDFLSRPAATEKRRDRQDLSKGVRYPEDIGLNEMLIRIGGAGQANGQLGGNRQIADATAMYGNIMDYNRGQALAKYKVDMANAKKTAKQARADQDYIGNIDQSLADMDKALAGLKSVDGNIFTGITGLWDGTVGSFLDSMTGDPKATTRLLLKKLDRKSVV